MTPLAVILFLFALAVGAAIGWLAASARKTAEAQTMLAAREAAMQAQLRAEAGQAQRAMAERDAAIRERARSEAVAAEAQRRIEEAQQARAVAETRAQEAERIVGDHAQFRKEMENAFVALAQKAFKSVAGDIADSSKKQIDGSLDTKKAEIDNMLKPLRDMLDGYRGELIKSEAARNEAYGGIQEQVKSLLAAQELSHREASRLANALQSPAVRGSWGESSLKRCVELAGMSEFCDFDLQATFSTDEGKRQRPDLIVRLPNNRVIAVDSKSPREEYVAASSEGNEERKKELLTQHARNLRRHIDSLSRKEYQASVGESLDFTVMYLPGEHFLSAALVTDPSLFEYAVERKIYLASPTVLLPLLRAVAAGWKAERTEENAKKMHDTGVELFNRFVRVMDLFSEVGARLGKTVEKFNETIRSIDSRLWPKGEELQRMAGSGKELGALEQIEVIPMESTKLRLTSQGEEPGVVVAIRD